MSDLPNASNINMNGAVEVPSVGMLDDMMTSINAHRGQLAAIVRDEGQVLPPGWRCLAYVMYNATALTSTGTGVQRITKCLVVTLLDSVPCKWHAMPQVVPHG